METNLVKTMNATEGMALVTDMIKVGYLAEVMVELYGGSVVGHTCMISSGVKHTVRNGKPYYYGDKYVDNLQEVIKVVGRRLLDVEITRGEQSSILYPLCHGETFVDKFKVLRKTIVLPYMFQQVMGRKERWQKMHLSAKTDFYYNKFSDSELQEINNAIRTISLTLCSIKLTYVGDNDNTNDNTNQDIPLPPYQYDFDSVVDYSKAYDEWVSKYNPTQEQQKELMAELLRQIDMDNEEALS